MNREEREAILHLRIYIEEDKTYLEYMETPLKELSDFDMFCYNHCRDIDIVLNLVDEQQTRIKELEKALIDEDFKNREKINKQNKIIDLMAKDLPSEFNGCTREKCITDKNGKILIKCEDCIKQYFENKVEE